MLVSAPVWTNGRLFPVLPITSWFPILPAPWDAVVFGALLVSLLAAFWRYQPFVIVFLIGSLFLALADQSRLQPWFYMYWVMLLLTLAPDDSAMTTCRLALSAVYVWAGIQKLNPDFFNLVVPWFVRPAADWLPAVLVKGLKWGLLAAPFIEVFIGVGLWFSRTRLAAFVAAVLIHLASLVLLGPLGHKHNWIIWPWNLVMPLLIIILFLRENPGSFRAGFRSQAWASVVVSLFCLLPVLSFLGKWDSYLSFSLYTGHLTKADLYISAALREKLPPAILEFVVPTPPPYNQELQGPYVVLVELWSDKILRVPPLPEARNYLNLARYLATLAQDPNDVRLVLIPRVGQTLFYRGSDLRKEAGIPLNF